MGPTGIGKTDLAFQLYDTSDIEIIGVDSVHVYKHLNIGSGKPNKEDLKKILRYSYLIRLNGSHNSLEWHKDIINQIKKYD